MKKLPRQVFCLPCDDEYKSCKKQEQQEKHFQQFSARKETPERGICKGRPEIVGEHHNPGVGLAFDIGSSEHICGERILPGKREKIRVFAEGTGHVRLKKRSGCVIDGVAAGGWNPGRHDVCMCTDGVKVGKSFFFGGVRRQDQPRTDGDGNLEKPQQERQKHRSDKL